MIPKIIHYCWYGNQPLSALEKSCISSWKEHLPDFEIRKWDESNSPLTIPFVKEAIKNEKWAFVADYMRFYALYHQGGIYLDTDMLVLKDFNPLLEKKCFFGCENENIVSCGIIGAQSGHQLLKEFLQYYESVKEGETKKPVVITRLCTDLMGLKGFTECNGLQEIEDVTLYPPDYFYPYPFPPPSSSYKSFIKETTYAVHLWKGSWLSEKDFLSLGRYRGAYQKIREKYPSGRFYPLIRFAILFLWVFVKKAMRFLKRSIRRLILWLIKIPFWGERVLRSEFLPFDFRYAQASFKPLPQKTTRIQKRGGVRFWVDVQEHNGWRIFYNLFTPGTRRLFSSVKKEYVILDVGANIGYYTLNFAKMAKEGKVIAMEPHPGNRQILQKNISLNNFGNIEVHEVAMGSQPGYAHLEIADPANNGMIRITSPVMSSENERVEISTLDDFVDKVGIDKIDLIKVDIEGYEMEFLKGGVNTLKNFKPRLFMELCDKHLKHYGSSANEVIGFLQDLGYTDIRHADTHDQIGRHDYLINCFMDITGHHK